MTESQDATPTVRASDAEDTVPGKVSELPSNHARRGESLGRYIVVEPLGQGAMGIVYKAFDPELDRTVAIKLLLQRGGATDSARLTREAQAMARIAHPNVISVYDVGAREDQVFFAMELVDGTSLRQWLQAETRSEQEILDVFLQAGAGMAAAHAAGVVHRDFKPDNVLVDSRNRPRVLDFGLARRHADSGLEESGSSSQSSLSVDLTRTGTIMGTPAYMAPEQYRGEAADARSDQFAFCIALFEALAGERPFQGVDLKSLRTAILDNDRVPPPGGRIPPEVMAALDRGLAINPEERFATMELLLEALTPSRGPRWGVIAASATIIGGLAVASAYGLGRQSVASALPAPCADVTEPIETTWSAQRRAALAQAFLDSAAFNAASMGERATAALDDYAQRWKDSAIRACNMVEVEHSLTERLANRSRRCLKGAANELESKIQAFEGIDAAGVQDSLDGIDALPNPEECIEPNWLELQMDPPEEADRKAILKAVGETHARVMAHYWTGDPSACLAGFPEYEALVRSLDHASTTARMLASRSQCELAAGRHDEASSTQDRSFEEALAAGDDLTAMNLSAETAYVIATRTDRLDAAETWLRRGEALLRRHALEGTRHAAGLLNTRAVLADRRGDHEGSVATLKQLVELTRDPKVPTQHRLTALSNVGVGLANTGDIDGAMQWFQSAADLAEEHYGAAHLHTADQRSRVAQALVIQGRYTEAKDQQRAALAIMRRAQPHGSLALVAALNVMGVIERQLGEVDSALSLYQDAYAMRERMDALETVTATEMLITLSSLLRETGDASGAEEIVRMAIRLREGAGSPPVDLAESHLELSRVHEALGDEAAARESLKRARTLALSAKTQTQLAERSTVLYSVAQQTLAMGDAAGALHLFARAESLVAEEDTGRKAAAGRVAYAELLRARGEAGRAEALVDAALADLEASPYPKDVLERAHALQAKLQ